MDEVVDVQMDQYRTPPNSKEAEDGVLGALLINNDAFSRIDGIIEEQDFYSYANRLIFNAIKTLMRQGKPADVITVYEFLQEKGVDDKDTGGIEYINSLADFTPSAANIVRYAEIIRDRSVRRQLITVGGEISTEAMNPGAKEAKELLDEAQAKVLGISDKLSRDKSGLQKIDIVLAQYTEQLKTLASVEREGDVTGVSTGFVDLDNKTSGFHDGELIIIAGRPAMGKTALALNIAQHVGVVLGLPVGIFSMEMTSDQVAGRLISSRSRITQNELKTGRISQWREFYRAVEDLSKSQIYVDETGGMNILSLRSKARLLKSKVGKIGLIVVDYLQLMSGEGGNRNVENRATEVAEISRGLKSLAKELGVPVIALSQLKREVDSRQEKRPLMSDLRESGSIEQDADLILFLYREDAYAAKHKEGDESPDIEGEENYDPDRGSDAELIIAKQRSGPTGTINLVFQGAYTRFLSKAYK